MRAIILSAGQGRRLLPYTAQTPKCLLPVDAGRTVLELQLRALADSGVREATVMVGFGAGKIERFLAGRPVPKIDVRTLYNPFFAVTDNLVTCWLARGEMTEDFLLLNGDTIVQRAIVRRMVAFRAGPIGVAIDRKLEYVEDDMKVVLDGDRRLRAVGKTILAEDVDGESIGCIAFRDEGVAAFRTALDEAVRDPAALNHWYLHVIQALAEVMPVRPVSIEGLWWTEIDSPADLAATRAGVAAQRRARRPTAFAASAPLYRNIA